MADLPDNVKFDNLTVDDIAEIAELIKFRQEKFGEPFDMSLGVVLFNYGDKRVKVRCVAGEWEGTKGDLPRADGVPVCPQGHVMVELNGPVQIGLLYVDS